jgi:hypothetical protein
MLARIVCLGVVLSLAGSTFAAPEVKLDAATQAKIRKLQTERRDELKKALRWRVFQLKGGQTVPKEVMADAESLFDAELALATSAAERLTAHAVHLVVAKELERMTESFVKAGLPGGLVVDLSVVRAARLKAEIAWLKAGGKDLDKEVKGTPVKDFFRGTTAEEQEEYRRKERERKKKREERKRKEKKETDRKE